MQAAEKSQSISQIIDQMKFVADSADSMIKQAKVNNDLQIESRKTFDMFSQRLESYRETLGESVSNACFSLVTLAEKTTKSAEIAADREKVFLENFQKREENNERRHNDLAKKLEENTAKTAEALFTLSHNNQRIDNMAEGIKNLCSQINTLTESIHKQQIASTEKINTLEVGLVEVSTKVNERWKGLAAVATLSIALSAAISKYIL